MARGGVRANAGRKRGALTKKSRAIAEGALEDGITPLEFLLNVMRADSHHEDAKVQVAREAMRFEAAKAAAPYMHAKLASLDVQAEHSGSIQFGWLS